MAILCSSASPMASCSWLPTKASPFLSSRTSVFFSSGASGLSRRGLSLVSRRRRESSGGGGGLDCRCLFGLGVPELVVIAGVAALVFGPKKLPEVGRSIGKTVKSFQQAAKEFEVELKKGPEDANQSPPAKEPKAVNSEELKKELEGASDTKESV